MKYFCHVFATKSGDYVVSIHKTHPKFYIAGVALFS